MLLRYEYLSESSLFEHVDFFPFLATLSAHSNLAVGKVNMEVRTVEIQVCFLECINNFFSS
jgi:hypothetical protein